MPCDTCHDTLYAEVPDPDNRMGYMRMVDCPACTPARMKQESLDAFTATLPERFKGAALNNITWGWLPSGGAPSKERVETYLGILMDNPFGAFCLYIHGGFGTGKTHLAVGVARAFLDAHPLRAAFMELSTHLATMRAAINDEKKEVDKYPNVNMLVLDDISAVRGTDWAKEYLYTLINYRYSRNLPTIITSNVPTNNVGELLGEAAASRIGHGVVEVFTGTTDRRRKLLDSRRA